MEGEKYEKNQDEGKGKKKKLKKVLSAQIEPHRVEKQVQSYEMKVSAKESESDNESTDSKKNSGKGEKEEEKEGESLTTQTQTNYEREERGKMKSFKAVVLDARNFTKPSKDIEKYARKGNIDALKSKEQIAVESHAFLHAAWAKNNAGVEVIKFLEKTVDVNMRDPAGYTALHLAAVRGNAKVVEVLLENPRIMVRPYDGVMRTPLMYAILHQNNEVVKLLAERENSQCNIKEPRADKLGNTSLHFAVITDDVEAVSMVANKVNVVKENEEGDTPLMLCARQDRFLAARAILGSFKNTRFVASVINHVDKNGVSAVHIAANKGSFHCLKDFLKYGDIVNWENETDKGITPLAFAAGSGSIETAKLLLDYFSPRGLDSVRNMIQYSPHVKKSSPWKIAVISKSDAEMTQLLLDFGAKVDEKIEGNTALYQVVMEAQRKSTKRSELQEFVKQLNLAALLLVNKADPSVPHEDETPHQVIVKNVKKYGVNEEFVKEHPGAAIAKWRRFVSAAASN